jgi:hypothetical protein
MKRLLVSLVTPAGIVAFTFAAGCGETTDLGGAVPAGTAILGADGGTREPDDADDDGPSPDEVPDSTDGTTLDDAEPDVGVPLAEAGDDDGSEPVDAGLPIGDDGAVDDAGDFD